MGSKTPTDKMLDPEGINVEIVITTNQSALPSIQSSAP